MTTPTRTPDEQALADALRADAATVQPAPDALALIQRRVAAAPRPTDRRRVVLVAVAAAAALAVVAGIGLRPELTPPPVETSVRPVPSLEDYPNQGARTNAEIYRVRTVDGRPVLGLEHIPVTVPLDPATVVQQLFTLQPLADGDVSPLLEGTTTVGSTTRTATELTLDLTAVGPARAPDPATATVWVQSLVRTTQSAWNAADLPVRITLDGRPTTLYGSVDTRDPIADAGGEVVTDHRIYEPRPGATVTSPVRVFADLGEGQYRFGVTDAAGREVGSSSTSGGAYIGIGFDLDPGTYTATVAKEGRGRPTPFTTTFTVSGPEPAVTSIPVTEPPTTPLPTVPVYFASERGLVRQDRALGPAVDVLNGYLAAPDGSADVKAGGGGVVAAVEPDGDGSRVDFSGLADGTETFTPLQLEAFVRTVQSVTGRDGDVGFTVQGTPVDLGTRPATSPSVVDGDGFSRQTAVEPGRLALVGTVRVGTGSVTYQLMDQVTQVTLIRGSVPVDPVTGRFAVTVAAPTGSYLLATRTPYLDSARITMMEATVA